jgi:hypothetical protein
MFNKSPAGVVVMCVYGAATEGTSWSPELQPTNTTQEESRLTLSKGTFSFSGWGETEPTWYVGHCWPIVPAPDDRWWLWSSWWNEDWKGKPKYLEKTCSSATLSTTNPTWPDLGSNLGHHGGKPATNHLSYGTAKGMVRPMSIVWLKRMNKLNWIDYSLCVSVCS